MNISIHTIKILKRQYTMPNAIAQKQFPFSFNVSDSTNPTVETSVDVTYSPNPQHRSGVKPKSIWDSGITEEMEFDIFKVAMENKWYRTKEVTYQKKKYHVFLSPNGRGWGFLQENGKFKVLGKLNTNDGRNDPVRFCVFEEGNPNVWHGYPADFKRNQDRPTKNVLKIWRDNNYIEKHDIKKIIGGSVCTL